MRTSLATICGVVVMGMTMHAATAFERGPHVRPLDSCAAGAIGDARARSLTVRDLESRLSESNVVAYVHCFWPVAGQTDAALTWVSEAASTRYVRVSLAYTLAPWRKVEMLGHELRHAVEVADAPWVHGEVEMAHLFTTIGFRTRQTTLRFETDAARTAELAVRRDLASTVSVDPVSMASGAVQGGEFQARGTDVGEPGIGVLPQREERLVLAQAFGRVSQLRQRPGVPEPGQGLKD